MSAVAILEVLDVVGHGQGRVPSWSATTDGSAARSASSPQNDSLGALVENNSLADRPFIELEASPALADTEHEAARAVHWKDVPMPRAYPEEFRQRAVELARSGDKPVVRRSQPTSALPRRACVA